MSDALRARCSVTYSVVIAKEGINLPPKEKNVQNQATLDIAGDSSRIYALVQNEQTVLDAVAQNFISIFPIISQIPQCINPFYNVATLQPFCDYLQKSNCDKDVNCRWVINTGKTGGPGCFRDNFCNFGKNFCSYPCQWNNKKKKCKINKRYDIKRRNYNHKNVIFGSNVDCSCIGSEKICDHLSPQFNCKWDSTSNTCCSTTQTYTKTITSSPTLTGYTYSPTTNIPTVSPIVVDCTKFNKKKKKCKKNKTFCKWKKKKKKCKNK